MIYRIGQATFMTDQNTTNESLISCAVKVSMEIKFENFSLLAIS